MAGKHGGARPNSGPKASRLSRRMAVFMDLAHGVPIAQVCEQYDTTERAIVKLFLKGWGLAELLSQEIQANLNSVAIKFSASLAVERPVASENDVDALLQPQGLDDGPKSAPSPAGVLRTSL
jgi:hypothetical protein